MIKLKNCGDYQLEFSIAGSQALGSGGTAQGSVGAIVPFNGRLSAIFGRMAAAAGTGTHITDVRVNGVSLTGGAGLITYASGGSGNTAPTYNTGNLTSNPVLVNKGDQVSIYNTQLLTTTSAVDQTVYINVERQRVGTFDDQIQTDTLGSDSDYI